MIFTRILSEEVFKDLPHENLKVYKNPTAAEFDEMFTNPDATWSDVSRIKLMLDTKGNLYAWVDGEHKEIAEMIDLPYGLVRMTMYLYESVSDAVHKWDDDGEYKHIPRIPGRVLNASVSSTPSWGAFLHATNMITPNLAKSLNKRIPDLKWLVGRETLFDSDGNKMSAKPRRWDQIIKIMVDEGLKKKR